MVPQPPPDEWSLAMQATVLHPLADGHTVESHETDDPARRLTIMYVQMNLEP